jgi:hypothetical protein
VVYFVVDVVVVVVEKQSFVVETLDASIFCFVRGDTTFAFVVVLLSPVGKK